MQPSLSSPRGRHLSPRFWSAGDPFSRNFYGVTVLQLYIYNANLDTALQAEIRMPNQRGSTREHVSGLACRSNATSRLNNMSTKTRVKAMDRKTQSTRKVAMSKTKNMVLRFLLQGLIDHHLIKRTSVRGRRGGLLFLACHNFIILASTIQQHNSEQSNPTVPAFFWLPSDSQLPCKHCQGIFCSWKSLLFQENRR